LDSASTSFVLGYHGCDLKIAERVLSGNQPLRPSQNDYDWLGDGIYFWEHNGYRAYQFAREARDRRVGKPRIKNAAVVGAIIDLGLCLNLLDSRFIDMVRRAHRGLAQLSNEAGTPLPKNSLGKDILLRKLDCAVIRFLHTTREEAREEPFDTVRAAFVEGNRLYENAGFATKNHIQICVRNVACIKGYFRPLDATGKPVKFLRR
jgi:hypothetical protein